MEHIDFLKTHIYPAIGLLQDLPATETVQLNKDEENEMAQDKEMAIYETVEIETQQTEGPVEGDTMVTDKNSLLEAVKDIGIESQRNDPGPEGHSAALVCQRDSPRPSSSSNVDVSATNHLMQWPLDMLSDKQKDNGIIPLLPMEPDEIPGQCLDIYRDTERL